MLKRLAIVSVLCAIATVGVLAGQQSPVGTPKQGVAESGSSKNGPSQSNSQSANQPTQPGTVNGQPTTPTCDEACQQGRQNLAIQGKLELFTGVMAIVGVLQVFLLYLTWKTIRRQTDAAARSTLAFINKERSRLFLSIEITPEFEVRVIAVNRGQSPARITYGFVGWELHDVNQEFPPIPRYTYPGDSPEKNTCDLWIIPRQSARIGICDAGFVSSSDAPELYEWVMEGKENIWFYGVVRWVDSVSEDEHEIRFCYKCSPSRQGKHLLFEDGPMAYRGEK